MEEKMLELMEKMYSELLEVKKDVKSIDQRLDRVEIRLDKAEQNQVRFENEVKEKLDILFDGYVQNTEVTNRVEAKVEYVAEKSARYEMDIKILQNAKKIKW